MERQSLLVLDLISQITVPFINGVCFSLTSVCFRLNANVAWCAATRGLQTHPACVLASDWQEERVLPFVGCSTAAICGQKKIASPLRISSVCLGCCHLWLSEYDNLNWHYQLLYETCRKNLGNEAWELYGEKKPKSLWKLKVCLWSKRNVGDVGVCSGVTGERWGTVLLDTDTVVLQTEVLRQWGLWLGTEPLLLLACSRFSF